MTLLTWIIAAGAAVSVLYGFWRWLKPKWEGFWRDVRAGRDALVGRPAMLDSITGVERVPALPGIGARMDAQETTTAATSKVVADMAESLSLLAKSHARLENHEGRITELETAAAERIVGKVEQIELWRAVEAAHKSQPDEPPISTETVAGDFDTE